MKRSVDVIVKAHDQASKNFTKMDRGLAGFNRRLERGAQKISRFSRRLLMLGAVAAFGIGREVLNAQEIIAKFEIVFKDQAKASEKFAKDFSKSIRRSKYAVMDFMTGIQDTFVPLGFSREKAAELAQEITKLTYDLAAWRRERPEQTINALQAALTGSHETVKRYGIIINETTLKEQLHLMGMKKVTGAALEKGKVLARLNLILAGSADAQGHAARRSGELSDRIAELKDQVRDAAIALGEQLLPEMINILKYTTELVSTFRGWAKAHGDAAEKIIKLGLALSGLGMILPTLVTSLKAVKGILLAIVHHPLIAGITIAVGAIAAGIGAIVYHVRKQNRLELESIRINNELAKAYKNRAKEIAGLSQRVSELTAAEREHFEKQLKKQIKDMKHDIQIYMRSLTGKEGWEFKQPQAMKELHELYKDITEGWSAQAGVGLPSIFTHFAGAYEKWMELQNQLMESQAESVRAIIKRTETEIYGLTDTITQAAAIRKAGLQAVEARFLSRAPGQEPMQKTADNTGTLVKVTKKMSDQEKRAWERINDSLERALDRIPVLQPANF